MKIIPYFEDTVSALLRRFWKDYNGNVAMVFGLIAVALISALGGGFDVNASVTGKNVAQSVIDQAVLAGVRQTCNEVATAQAYFDVAIAEHGEFNYNVVSRSFQMVGNELVGNATGETDTIFLSLLGFTSLTTNIRTSASLRSTGRAACIMAMHPTEKHTLELHNTIRLNSPDCNYYGNSDHYNDVIDPHSSDSFVIAASVQTVGGGHHYLQNVIDVNGNSSLGLNSEVVDNPYPAYTMPNYPSGGPASQTYETDISINSPHPHFVTYPPTPSTPGNHTLTANPVSTYNAAVYMEGVSSIQPGGLTINFTREVHLGVNDTLSFGSGTTNISRGLAAGTINVMSGATVNLSNCEVHATRIVVEGTLNASNCLFLLHGSAGTVEIEARTGATIRLSGWRGGATPYTGANGHDWTGFAIYSRHTPDMYTFAKRIEIYSANAFDVEGIVFTPETFFYWEQTGVMTCNHQWTAYFASGFNWRGSGSGPNEICYNFDTSNTSGVPPYPSHLLTLIPGLGNSAILTG